MMKIRYKISEVKDFGDNYRFEGEYEIVDGEKVVKKGLIRHSMTNPYEVAGYDGTVEVPRWKKSINSLMEHELKAFKSKEKKVSENLKPKLNKFETIK